MQKNIYSGETLCIECNGKVILHQGIHVCKNCGLEVTPEYLPPLYKINPSKDQPSIERHYVALGDRIDTVDGMGSYIGFPRSAFFYDTRGRPLTSKIQNKYKRLKYKYDRTLRISKRETDYRVLKLINRVTNHLQLSNEVKNRAAYFYKKIATHKGKKSYTNHVMLASVCLLTAVREFGVNAPSTIQEIAKCFNSLGHRVTTRRIVREMLKLRVALNLRQTQRRSIDYIYRIVAAIMSSEVVQIRLKSFNEDPEEYRRLITKKVFHILKQIKADQIGGRNPYIFAVSTIYAADKVIAKKRRHKSILTQQILAKIAGVAEYSIRDHYCRLLKNHLKTNLRS
ncbi:MAG: hypothetical protein ACXABG_14890 [Promethearchaeota archaeon]